MSTESGREKRWTPGPWAHIPWHVAEGDPEVRASKSHLICTTDTDQNARLIAAAPELVEALEAFLRAPSVGSDGPGSSTIVVQDYNLRAARAALAKAYGEES